MTILMHGHHENTNGCPLSFFEGAQGRVDEIVSSKPANERDLRLALLREVDPATLPPKAQKARATYAKAFVASAKARAAYAKAFVASDKALPAYAKALAAYDKALAACIKACSAYVKACSALVESLTRDEWAKWHAQNCTPRCPWTKESPSIFSNGYDVMQLLEVEG